MRKIKLKVRFDTSKESFEKVSSEACLLYLPYAEDEDSITVIKEYISKNFGTPTENVEYMGKDNFNNFLFILN
jgi:hypothetical protein